MKNLFVKQIGIINYFVIFLIFFLAIYVPISFSEQPSYGMPSDINPSAKYFFFLHNYYVETNGTEGECRYHDILEAFEEKGFVVISEVRTGKIVPCTYAQKVANQVRALLNSGVPPQNIYVGGHSKGGVITLCVASGLENPKVNFIIMAGCEIAPIKKYNMYPDMKKLKGRILSVYATSDSIAGSCEKSFSESPRNLSSTEIQLESDQGHKLFFTPNKIWIDPVIRWINNG